MVLPVFARKHKRVIFAFLLILVITKIVATSLPYHIKSTNNYTPERGDDKVEGILNFGFWTACIKNYQSYTDGNTGEIVVKRDTNNCYSLTNNSNLKTSTSQICCILSICVMIFHLYDYSTDYFQNTGGSVVIWIIGVYCSIMALYVMFKNVKENISSDLFQAENNVNTQFFHFYKDWGFYLDAAVSSGFYLFTLILKLYSKF